mmetsp:Transcript_24877/g.73561  ORF Transcript_24877/g.73561 Transcript_24877/m.73561 type:complete len:342 (-) Transcript_24877:557-1582(-)
MHAIRAFRPRSIRSIRTSPRQVRPDLAASVHSDLVVARRGDVPHPRQRLVAAFLDDLQVSHLDARDSVVRDLKLDPDRWHLALRSVVLRSDARQIEVAAKCELPPARKALDRPHQGALLRNVHRGALAGLDLRPRRIGRQRQYDLHVVSDRPLLELAARLHQVLGPAPARLVHKALDRDKRLDVLRQTVRHEVKVAVGGDERDGAVVLEAREPHALVELDVLQLNRLLLARAALVLEEDLVVEPQLALGHAGQEHAHAQHAGHLTVYNAAVGVDQQVDRLDRVQKDLVFRVLDPFVAPVDGVGDRHWRLHDAFHSVCVGLDELAQDLGLRELRVTMVHDFV